MKIKTSELTDHALDRAVAKCEGHDLTADDWRTAMHSPDWDHAYTEDWAQGGPIIEREGMALHMEDRAEWVAAMWWDDTDGQREVLMKGPTPLIAAMRCYVASKLGDEVDVPDELG